MADRTGQQLGNYRLVRLLGRGGFAEVYLGEHRFLKSYAALKVLLTSLKDEDIERFLSEAQTLVRLMHPNIVRVLEFSVDRGTPVLVMDYAPGGTLRHHHPRGTCLSLATTVAYTVQVATALQYAHNHNVIHRDVKPENILLGPAQQILLSDFGIALLTQSSELLSTQEMAGTLPYTAPEQLQGKPSFASDQYALGIVVYEWLCGKRPFEGNHLQLIHQHLFAAPQPLRETFPELPAAVEDVVLRALAKDPQQRFVSVQAFAQALERASQMSSVDLSDDDDTEITVPLKKSPHKPFITPPDRTPQMVFLSASHADDAFAARLKADLETRGILFWNDDPESTLNTLAQDDQEEAVRQAIRAAHIALVVLSPEMRSSRTLKEHLRIASLYGRKLVFVWAAGDDIAEILPDAWGKSAVVDLVDARQTRYETALVEIVAYLEEETSTTSPMLPAISKPRGEPRNPYKGLRAFGKDDATDFFGRDALVQELVETMRGALTSEEPGIYGARLLTVIGPSGSGKSSVVMAGLLPQLQKGALPGSEEWVYLEPMMPGKNPLESLILTLASRLPNRSLRSIREDLEDESARGLHLLAARIMKRPGSRVVLMIDQFEELFTSTPSEDERRHFIDLLVTAVTELRGPVIVLLTLRADFYDRPLSYPELGLLIQDYQRVVLPMEIEDLRAAIEQPAALPDVELTFEGNLVGDLLFEAKGQAGALPLLEFTLDQLFQQRDGHWLTQQAYQKIGGVRGALAKHAESTYAPLPSEEHRRLAQALFLRLIDPGVTEQDTTRRRAALTELSLTDPKQTIIIQEVADAFVAARLLTTNVVAGTTTIEVSHEALIREWERLSEWLREAREDITLQQSISTDVADWIRRGKPVDRVYRGAQLVEAQEWAERNVPSADEVAFLQVSAAERQQQEELELSRQARELNLQRRVVSRQRILITALSVFSVIVIVLGSVAGLNYLQAQTQQKLAEMQTLDANSRALAADSAFALSQDALDRALLLSVWAWQTDPTPEARDSLLSALEKNPQIISILHNKSGTIEITGIVFHSNGHTFIATDGQQLYTGDTITRQISPLPLDDQLTIGGMALSPDGQTLATSSAEGVWLRSTQKSVKPSNLAGKVPGLSSNIVQNTPIAFTSDGQLVESARCSQYSPTDDTVCIKTQISIFNVQSKQPVGSPYAIPGDANTAAFSLDGKILASTSGTNIQIWNVATGNPLPSPITGITSPVTSMAFSPGNQTLATGSQDGSVRLWDVMSGRLISDSFIGHKDAITGLAFSPNGTSLAASSRDKTVLVWDVSSGLLIDTLNGDSQEKGSVAFSPDGTTLASGSMDGTILLWNIAAESAIARSLVDTDILWGPVFTPDGTQVLTGNSKGQVILQNVKTGQPFDVLKTDKYPLLQPKDQISADLRTMQSLALSGDGSILAAGRLDGTIVLWNMHTRTSFAHFMYPTLLFKVSLSANGKILAAVGSGDKIILWNVTNGTKISSIPYDQGQQLRIPPVALSPDGKVLAVGTCVKGNTGICVRGLVQLWDVATGKLKQSLSGHSFSVSSVAFSPDGHILASGSQDGILLWDVLTGKPAGNGQMLSIPADSNDYYNNLVFSSNGGMLASSSPLGDNFSFVLWNVAPGEPLGPLTHAIEVNASSQGSIAFAPNGQQLATVSVTQAEGLGIFLLWDITVKSWEAKACFIANRDLNPEEWRQFGSGGTTRKVC